MILTYHGMTLPSIHVASAAAQVLATRLEGFAVPPGLRLLNPPCVFQKASVALIERDGKFSATLLSWLGLGALIRCFALPSNDASICISWT